MAVIWAQIAKTASRVAGGIEPDVRLIKQVEQVTTPALEGPTWRFARIPSIGESRTPSKSLYFLFGNYCIGCYLAAKTARKGPRATCGNAAGPNRR